MRDINQYIETLIDSPSKTFLEQLDKFESVHKEIVDTRPTKLEQFKPIRNRVSGIISMIKNLNYNVVPDIVSVRIQNDLELESTKFAEAHEAEINSIIDSIDNLKSKIEAENREHNNSLRDINLSDNTVYNALEEKRQILVSYSDKIFDVCSEYGITTSDIPIDESLFTPDKLNSLYDDYISFMTKEESGSNIVAKFRAAFPSEMFQGVCLLVVLVLCFTRILDFVSIGFITLLFINQIKNVSRFKYYSTLAGLTFNVNPANLGYVEFDDSQLLPETLTEEMLDEDPRFEQYGKALDDVEEKYSDNVLNEMHAKYLNEYSLVSESIVQKVQNYSKDFEMKKSSVLKAFEDELKWMDETFEKLKSEFKFLGQVFSKSYVLDTNFSLGLKDGFMEQFVDTKNLNLIIRPVKETNLMYSFIRALYANAITHVWPGKVTVTVYDPYDLGRALLPFYNIKVATYLTIEQTNSNQILDRLTAKAQSNLQMMRGTPILEYNRKCEELGMTPIDYELLIMLSEPKDLEESEKLKKFFEYSHTAGVYIWVVSPELTSNSAFIFNKPFEGVEDPITNLITDDWCKSVTDAYIEAIDKSRPPGLPWNEFIDNVIPESKIWSGCADDVAEMYPGYANGDPNKYDAYTVGNQGNVHAIGVGGTGAGKSVFLNHLIATLTREYSPKELELWLCDFKGSEFVAYLDDSDAGAASVHPFMLPHIKACLCTSDGDYATSLFHALRSVADKRYDIFSKPSNYVDQLKYCPDGITIADQKGCRQWNEAWRKKAADTGDKGYLENIWPRIIFICDEFQVIFEKADPKNLDQIKADITQIAKVGRAANVSIFFTSQSMKKTLSADILQQFTLRFVLRCDKDVSAEILGNSNASDIRDKYGYLYVRDFAHMSAEEQIRYKTPYFPDSNMLYAHIKDMSDRAKAANCAPNPKDVITYREDTVHPIEQLKEFYELNADKFPQDYGMFFIGMRMSYSENKAPDNFILSAQNNTNVIALAPNYNDFVLLFNDLVTNINCNKIPGTIIINSQVADLAYLTDAESYITREDHKAWLSDKVKTQDFFSNIQKIFESRKQKNKKDTPVWVFCLGWDKGQGFGVDSDVMLRNKLASMLQTCGEYNIHFIFLSTGTTGFALSIINACKYLMACKCSTDDSMNLIGTKQASTVLDKLPTGWVVLKHDGITTRDKLWVTPIEREISVSEFIL